MSGMPAEPFVFTLVRNPWGRIVSLYHWARMQTFETGEQNVETTVKMTMSLQDAAWLETLEQTILAQLSDFDFNVEQLAREMTMGKRSLERKIKTLVGMTAAKYIQENNS